jgi:catechol 2,3-dioxygenase-like lactoylglutathione lyase family enzyme
MNQEHSINIRLIDHVVIRVQNLVRMIDSYCDVLGCRLEPGLPPRSHRTKCGPERLLVGEFPHCAPQ